jgi:benzoyl-CoA reductase/2-hydroxyglutaryl-CoA dehydratase subunit BcrC/BadD/HgdB
MSDEHPLGWSSPGRYVRESDDMDEQELRDRARKEYEKQSTEQRERLRQIEGRPKAMRYFDDVARYDGPRVKELERAKAEGRHVVGTLCVFAPAEVIRAAGGEVVRLCSGQHHGVHPANELLGDAGLCPCVKSTLGGRLSEADLYLTMADIIIAPASCDGKVKLGEILEDYLPVIMMNLPRVKTGDTTAKLWIEEVLYMMRELSRLTGVEVTTDRLKEAIEVYNRGHSALARIDRIRRGARSPIWGRDALLAAQMALVDDIERWTGKMEALATELEGRVGSGQWVGEGDEARILLAGSPILWPNWKVPNIIEESGGLIVADELCTGDRVLGDPVVTDEGTLRDMVRAVAERYFFPCTCPCFSPNDERESRMLNLVREHDLEGVVYHALRGCHLGLLESTRLELALRRAGVPLLKIESEYDEGDVEQIRTRVEAFVEMIQARREFRSG